MQFKNLNAKEISKFETKFGDDLATKLELSIEEIATLSKREFNELINIVYKDETITGDNIHLYYEFMSDDEKINYCHTILKLVFDERETLILKLLDITKVKLQTIEAINTTYYKKPDFYKGDYIFNDGFGLRYGSYWGTIGISYFGIKDTLKPIDEYIEEIKESSEYILKIEIDKIINEKDFNRLEYWRKKAMLKVLFDNFKNVFCSYNFITEKNFKINSLDALVRYVKDDNHIVKFSLNDKTFMNLYSNNGFMSIEDDAFKMFQEHIVSLA